MIHTTIVLKLRVETNSYLLGFDCNVQGWKEYWKNMLK